jgi:hypothetical protein
VNKTEAPENSKRRLPRRGPGLFILGTTFIVGTVAIGLFVERELFSRVMFYIQQRTLPPFGQFYPYQMLLTMWFAFGLPIGVVFAFIYSIKKTEMPSPYVRWLILSGFGIFFIVILTPIIFGRELGNLFFAVMGISIIVSVLLTFWFTSEFRYRLDKEARVAMDFKLLGYLCFGIVTWHVCGFANSPGFAIYPEKMIELGVQPFAVGQLKSIAVYFTVGWILTAIGFYKSMRYSKSESV